ncbi:MAG: FG-GAP-like repeat-containing protein, partial [Vicinamibacteria bacterium]
MSCHRLQLPGSLLAATLALAAAVPTARATNGGSKASESCSAREAAYRESNLGVALLEQFRFVDAVEAFSRAIEKDPTLALARVNRVIAYLYVPDHDAARREAEAALESTPDSLQLNYILGLVARGEGRAEDAVPYLKKVLEEDPKDLGANLTLGQSYLQLRRFDEAVEVFRIATQAEPYNVSAVYNLGMALNRAGQREEARQVLERFQKLRDSAYKTSLGSTYLEQGKYAEALASTGAEPGAVDPRPPEVSFVEREGALIGDAGRTTVGGKAPIRSALVLSDLDGDGAFDVVEAGAGGLRVLKNEGGRLRDVTEKAGLSGIAATAAVAGDYDNDHHPDLLLLRAGGLSLFRNDGSGHFEDATAAAGLPSWPYLAGTAAFVDIDHDGDLDVFVGGLAAPPAGSAPAPALLLQNNGDGTFADVTEHSRLGALSRSLAVVPTDFDNRRDVDLFVVRQGEPPALYKNLRDGSFRDVASELGLVAPGGVRSVAAGDVNKDGSIDFVLGGTGPSWIALSDGRGAFRVSELPSAAAAAEAAQLVDYDNDGLLDLFVVTGKGLRLLRNLGGAWSDVTEVAFAESLRTTTLEGAALGIADLDADGDQDAVLAVPGRLVSLTNEGGNRNHSFAVDLTGRVSNRGGVGAKIEIRAGALRQKIETSAAVPMAAPADAVFGLGARPAPDAVRVIWVSGIVQTEIELDGAPEPGKRATLGVMEIDRKPSSCPFLYAWDGERFAFVTDFLGGGEMGYGVAPRVWNHPDPVEYVRIAPGGLRPRQGRYEIRVTIELEEVLYVDHVRLLAVDHPEDVSVYPDEGMTVPPKAFRLFAVRDPQVPLATDHAGRDVTARVA